MLNKLRLFVKEYMEVVLAGIGSLLIGLAFASFVHATDKDTSCAIVFYWLSLAALLAGIGFYIWCFIKGAAKEKREREESELRKQEMKAVINSLTNNEGIPQWVREGTEPPGSKPSKPKEDKNATS